VITDRTALGADFMDGDLRTTKHWNSPAWFFDLHAYACLAVGWSTSLKTSTTLCHTDLPFNHSLT
jgi:hypothetical protein